MIASLLLELSVEPSAASDTPPRWFLAAIVGLVIVFALFILRMAVVSNRRRARARHCASCGNALKAAWVLCPACGAPQSAGPALATPVAVIAAASPASPAASTGRAAIEWKSGPLSGQTSALDQDVTTIGSFESNTVLLKDTGVSRKHAGIRRVDGGYELADLGSTNGVYVNGEKAARRKLVAGDVIRIGTSEAVFRS